MFASLRPVKSDNHVAANASTAARAPETRGAVARMARRADSCVVKLGVIVDLGGTVAMRGVVGRIRVGQHD